MNKKMADAFMKRFGHWEYSPAAQCNQPDYRSKEIYEWIMTWNKWIDLFATPPTTHTPLAFVDLRQPSDADFRAVVGHVANDDRLTVIAWCGNDGRMSLPISSFTHWTQIADLTTTITKEICPLPSPRN